MSDLATLNKTVSLSSASHDFVLLAKSLAAAKWRHFRNAGAGPDCPVDARARSSVGSEGSAVADVVIKRLGVGTIRANGQRVFR